MFWWCVFLPKWRIFSAIFKFSEMRNVTFSSSIFVEWKRGVESNLVEAVQAIRLHLSVVNGINELNGALNLIHTKSQEGFSNAVLNSTFAWSTPWQLPPSSDRSYYFRSTSTFTLFNKSSISIRRINFRRRFLAPKCDETQLSSRNPPASINLRKSAQISAQNKDFAR